ncbi:MAG TPA: nucleotide exchange factor GrpE [Candidatus Limnocylindria bacterium]|jgi:molecular chaperone GrpE|nr:nucleotide exchange factor GrpE [Candidatus Limnocylindria bacterium]
MSDNSNDTHQNPGGGVPGYDGADSGVGPESLADLAALKEQAAKAADYYERLVRTTADFDNFKKRAARDRDEARRSGLESVITRLLPALDNFEMALVATNQAGVSLDTVRTGVTMIQSQLKAAIAEFGVEEVNALGQTFDPAVHEAVSQQETAEVQEGQVVQQLRKGYRLRDRLLRPASVVVSRKPSA